MTNATQIQITLETVNTLIIKPTLGIPILGKGILHDFINMTIFLLVKKEYKQMSKEIKLLSTLASCSPDI